MTDHDGPAGVPLGEVSRIADEGKGSTVEICGAARAVHDQIEQIEKDMSLGDNPRDTKASLARHIVARYHGEKAATEAEAAWNKQFREGGQPDEIQQHKLKLPINIIEAIADVFGISKSESRRLVSQKGVKYAGKVVDKPETELKKPGILQLGKRRYAEILKK